MPNPFSDRVKLDGQLGDHELVEANPFSLRFPFQGGVQ